MRTRRSILLATLIACAVSVPATPAGSATPGAPRLRLRAVGSSVDLVRYGKGSPVWLEPGVAIAALDAPFDLRLRRASYDDPITVSQAFHDSGGITYQDLPADILSGWDGLVGFLRVRLFSTDGRLLRDRFTDACPSGWDAQRIDDSGPFEPTYPAGCWSHPFALGTVWGIDQGWAVQPVLTGDLSVRVPDGDYRAVVSITRRYRELFGVADADGSVELAVRIHTRDRCRYCAPAAPAVTDTGAAPTVVPTVDDPDPATIPDLVALPAFWIGTRHEHERDLLTFGSNVWNRGPASLVVEGFRLEGQDLMDAYQYFLLDGEVVGRALVGSFEYDQRRGHHHWHMQQFVRYRLLDETLGRVVRSHKQSFCLAPTDAIDLSVAGAIWRPEWTGFSHCGYETALWIRELMPTGWGDTYYQGVEGQAFDITNVQNGTYWIQVEANPLGVLFDGDASNDAEVREVVIGGRPGHRTVFVPPWHGIDTG